MRDKLIALLRILADRLEPVTAMGVQETIWKGDDIRSEVEWDAAVNPHMDMHGNLCIEFALGRNRYIVLNIRHLRRAIRAVERRSAEVRP